MHKKFECLPEEPTPRWRNFEDDLPFWLIPPDEMISQREGVVQERELLQCLSKALATLSQKERFVVERHFGIKGTAASFTAIAVEMNVSKQRVGQICTTAQKRLLIALEPQAEVEND